MPGLARFRAGLAATALVALACGPAGAQEIVGGDPNVTVVYYEIAGRSYDDLKREIDAKGPDQLASGKRAAGWTETKLSYSWTVDSAGGCDLSKAEVGYKIVVTLPKLAPGSVLTRDAAEWWRPMIHNLRLHEMDHVRLALGYIAQMQQAIRSATCDTAKDEAQRVMSDYSRANAEYDRLTAHGTRLAPRRRK